MGQATTWTGVFFYHCSDELMYSRASALLLLLLKLVVSVLEMASNKRLDEVKLTGGDGYSPL